MAGESNIIDTDESNPESNSLVTVESNFLVTEP